ncbi:ATP-dependent DNA helicase RecG [Rhodococcus kronopolitis]|uniref:ATP-dependent DNA helicase RecG n=1 Tax=Rhodococcus kronopolitis TaxID=1460226 RepID=A0ABV9FJX4_9NOCA
MATLTDRLDHLLGKKTADVLAEVFDIHTAQDLLRHYPHRYATKGAGLGAQRPPEGSHLTVVARVSKTDLRAMRSGRGFLLKVTLMSDEKDAASTETIDATFFNGQKVKHLITKGTRAMFSGKVKYFNDKPELTHPSYLLLPEVGDDGLIAGSIRGAGELAGMARGALDGGDVDMTVFERDLIPLYPATREVESWTLMKCVRQVLDQLDDVEDPLPEAVRREHGLIGLDEALRIVHLPDTKEEVTRARDRLRFDEAAALQLVLAQRRHTAVARSAPACPPHPDGIAAAFEEMLPFTLTDGQQTVADEISADLSRPHPMNRLLQGEVGSGKTVVALRAMLQVIDGGYQCALLAPTEVLAAQHARSLRQMLGNLGSAGELGAAEGATRVTLLTGSMSVPARRAAMLEAVSGDAGIVIGTHALIQDKVEFFNLGMVVVDEQHRFGVEQRDALRSRGRDGVSPHLLVMTATPIPRTIAMTVLGDLETSTLRELPRGRSPIVSKVVPARERPAWVDRAWERIREEVAQGRQAYVVCSRIGEGDEDGPDAKEQNTVAALALFDELRFGALSELRVGLLHGRLPADEKDAVMKDFTAGRIDVLVCTTVVEVGVDVPNATVMVLKDADRFGVSQLHQLRGRVGRGAHPGLCILITDMKPNSPAFQRLSAVAGTNDGFELAQLDLAQRREGDVLGAAQSGTLSTLRLLSLLDHEDVIESARVFAQAVVTVDPELTAHPGLASMVTAALASDRIEFLDKS